MLAARYGANNTPVTSQGECSGSRDRFGRVTYRARKKRARQPDRLTAAGARLLNEYVYR